MSESIVCPIGVCILPQPPPNMARTLTYPRVALDTLVHYGIPHAEVPPDSLSDALPFLKVLVTLGNDALPKAVGKTLCDWVEAGGVWIGVGGVAAMPAMFGVEVEGPTYSSWGGGVGTLGEGYLTASGSHPVIGHLRAALHHFNGLPARVAGDSHVIARALDRHQRPADRVAVAEARHGAGRCLLIAPDLTGAIVRIRQGIGITRDGVPSSDGTAPICDEVLKSGDGFALDWDFDRQDVPGAPGLRAFLEPQADLWSELLVRSALYGAQCAGLTMPMLWLYPRDLPAVGALSHDSDGNDADLARAMLAEVARAGVRSTWCVQAPGYAADVIDDIRRAGHELAMHFDAMSGHTQWSAEDFAGQHAALRDLFRDDIVSNKNHYLRWEGDVEFFEWCAAHGVRLDQSKGASKTGEAGYNFGTCHPYLPVRRDGSVIPVYELATPTQDLVVFAPQALADALTHTVLRAHGVLHLLFHPAHIRTAGVADAMHEAIGRAREHGVEWWTARDLVAWEDARRSAAWNVHSRAGAITGATLRSEQPLADATVLWLHPEGDVERFGFSFVPTACTISPKKTIELEVPV